MTIHVDNDIKLLSRNNGSGLFTYLFAIMKLLIFVMLGGSLLFGVFQSIRRNSLHGFVDGVVVGVVGALVAVPVLVFLDIFQKLKCYLRYKSIDFRVDQERRFIIKDDHMSVFNNISNVLNNIKNIEIYKKNMENGIVEAVAKRSWRSFGEEIKIELFKSSGGKVLVVLSSKPRISLMLIDYSKNFENVEMIVKGIIRNFSKERHGTSYVTPITEKLKR